LQNFSEFVTRVWLEEEFLFILADDGPSISHPKAGQFALKKLD
jgi:hypothetical protein